MPFTENRAVFFDPQQFGSVALYRALGSDPGDDAITVNGIFDSAFDSVQDTVEDTSPYFTCDALAIATPRHGDALEVAGDAYAIVGIEPDGTGVVRFKLALV